MNDSYQYTGEEGKPEIAIIDSLIKNTGTTSEQAVQRIVDLTLAPETPGRRLGDHCWYTACALLEVAAHTAPDQHSKLVAFFHKLRGTTVTDPSSGEPLKHDDSVIWKELPTFGYTFADELNSIPTLGPGSAATPEKTQRWQNIIAFIAQLDASTQDPVLDYGHTWAPVFISSAFSHNASFEKNEITVRLACMWYIYDAEKLWGKISDTGDFTRDNWKRWKQDLENAKLSLSDQQTQSMLDKALSEIKRVESIAVDSQSHNSLNRPESK